MCEFKYQFKMQGTLIPSISSLHYLWYFDSDKWITKSVKSDVTKYTSRVTIPVPLNLFHMKLNTHTNSCVLFA